MSEFKGTPGPWIKHTTDKGQIMVRIPTYYGERVVYREITLGKILDDDCGVETCCRVEEHSNARLIASAPELLEALQLLLSQIPSDLRKDWLYGECQKAESAINKALGKEATRV